MFEMKHNGNKLSLLAAATIACTIGTHASAQTTTDERIQELIRQAAARAGVAAPFATTGLARQTSAQTMLAGRPVVQLTLDDAIKLALDRNLDISVQRLNPQTYDFSLAGLHANYRPMLTSTIGQQSNTNPSTQTIQGASAGTGINQGIATYNAGIAQNLRWGGGDFAIAINNDRRTTTSPTALFDPAYITNWSASYTQPLFRNFRTDSVRQQLVVTKLNQDISEIQLQSTIINTLANVRNAYWDLVFGVESVAVARRSVELAERLVSDNRIRVEIGTMAPIDVVQAQAQAATQRQNLATAEGTRRTTELALKRLIVSGTQDPNWNATLDPIERPEFVPAAIDVAAAVRRAIENRTDIEQVRKNMQVNDVTLDYLRNQTLPQVDFTARYGLVGQGGTRFIRAGGISGQITDTIPGGYTDALQSLFGRNYPTWNFGVNVTYPIGISAQEATVARARVQQNQVEAQIRQIELEVATDVTNAATNVQNNVDRVEAAQAAREFSLRQLEAEQSKFEVGMSTNYFVVQAQRDLLTAQNNELEAILAYRRSLVELERLQQTSLQSSNITILGR
jgi:outer membrane protein